MKMNCKRLVYLCYQDIEVNVVTKYRMSLPLLLALVAMFGDIRVWDGERKRGEHEKRAGGGR